MFGEVIAAQHVEELVRHPRLAAQVMDEETVEMSHAQCSLNLVFDVVDDPGRISKDGPFQSEDTFGVFLVVDIEQEIDRFSLCGVEIDLLLDETVDLGVVHFDLKCVLGLGLIVNPHFCDGRQAAEGNGKGHEWILRAVTLLGADHMLSHG